MKTFIAAILALFILGLGSTRAQEAEKKDKKTEAKKKPALDSGLVNGLKLRGIGPALMSGRIGDIAIHPRHKSTWYVAVASGGVWKTRNRGTTWTPIFDGQGSYSIGCVAIDPNNFHVVWVGTGENNSQRSVGFGDGVYKSVDDGRSWKNVGLGKSEHIGKILVDPMDSDVVYVAAQGPLWAPGGDRGLYKTTDGGATWKRILEISENTGVTDVVFDPRNSDVLYAASYQRRRHVWTLIDGGPESVVYKTVDGGETWKKLRKGLPGGDVGRIGLAISPMKPDVVYALVEAAGKGSGFYRSADAGRTWSKRSSYLSTSPQYYQEIFADPHVFDRVYSLDTVMKVTDDGGKTFKNVGRAYKHVDDHALAFDEDDPDYLLAGCDGGVYESFDRGRTWDFKANLPVTQFYKLCVDNALPFYNVYGGTQDNNTQGGPSRTLSSHGITNEDWFITVGGDGFKPQVDPEDPNIVYAQYQYGGLRRFDRKNGSMTNIQPQPGEGEEALRFNWDSALLISPHAHTRLYFGANRLMRSDDRGDSWRAVSPDLTRRIDRNKLEVMGKVWSIDAVAKNRSTSYYGTLVSLTESPRKEGLLYTGADDGLIQVTGDGGKTWRKVESVEGVPERTYVSDLEASVHDAGTVFACFNNHKMGDFKPYISKSTDRGRTWVAIQGNLPARGPVWAVAQDHVNGDLLFAGTEFGVFFTVDGGKHWVRLKSGIPTIAVRDIEIQRRENDLVCGTFGRGFYILDDYTPLRHMTPELLDGEAAVFPVKQTWIYTRRGRLGGGKKASQGHAFYTAPNPPFGAVFTYYLKDVPKTRKQKRKAEEKKGGAVEYPTWEELRAEAKEESPTVLLTITDQDGNRIRRIKAPASRGIHRVAWNLRLPSQRPASLGAARGGLMAVPGTYCVHMALRVNGKVKPLAEARTFEVVPLGSGSLPAPDREAWLAAMQKAGRLQGAVLGTNEVIRDATNRVKLILKVLKTHPRLDAALEADARDLEKRLEKIQRIMHGDALIRRHQEPTPPSLMDRVRRALSENWNCAPTRTQREAYAVAAQGFEKVLAEVKILVQTDLKGLEDKLDRAGAPWTPGRMPNWKRESR